LIYAFLLFACAKIAIFEPGASKILIIFCAGVAKIADILALASSKVGSVAIFSTSSTESGSFSIIPPIIFKFELFFANLVKIFAEVIASSNALVGANAKTFYTDWATPGMYDVVTQELQKLIGGAASAEDFISAMAAESLN